MASKVETIRRVLTEQGPQNFGLTGGAIVELDDRLLAHETRLRAIEEKARGNPGPEPASGVRAPGGPHTHGASSVERASPSSSPGVEIDPDAALVEELAFAHSEAWLTVEPSAKRWDGLDHRMKDAYRAEARAALALLRARSWGPKSKARKVRKLTDADATQVWHVVKGAVHAVAQDAPNLNALGFRRVR